MTAPRPGSGSAERTPTPAAAARREQGGAEAAPIDNRLLVLVLQHPQERREALGTAALLCRGLARAEIRTGLSWPNLAKALGRPERARGVDPRRWAVLYLGSARPAALLPEHEVIGLDSRDQPAADQAGILRGLDGIVLLDGSWKEAKTLWWRNPWLLKLRRLVLNPKTPSRYGRLRREPRREALSTLEAAALLLARLEGRPEIETALLARFDHLIAASRAPARVAQTAAASANADAQEPERPPASS